MRLSLLLPTLNEREGIQATLRRVPRLALTSAGYDLRILCIDGSSTDGTQDAARALGADVLAEPRPGYGRAYKTGFAAAHADLVVTADADDTYPVDLLPRYLDEHRRRGLDFATLNRFAHLERDAMNLTHRFGNGILTTAARLLYGVRLRDSQSGMWILNRRALDRIPYEHLSEGMAFSQEIKLAAFLDPELHTAELGGAYRPRVGHVKLARWSDGPRNLTRLVRHRFRTRPPGHDRA